MEFTPTELDALETLLVTAIHAIDHDEDNIDILWMDQDELKTAHDKIYAKINY